MGSVTKILKGHTIGTGADFRKLHENYYQSNTPNGGFIFQPRAFSSRQRF